MEHQKEKNMKKLIATVLIALITFAAFAAINVTIDTITSWGGKPDPLDEYAVGFNIGGADETVFADMNATLSGGRGSALLNIRFRIPSERYAGAAVEVHGWEIKAKVTDWMKLSVGNTALELYAESINWEPIFGAGLFEQGKNRIYLDMQFGDLRLVTGMSMGQNKKKPWDTLEVAASYDVSFTTRLSAEFRLVPYQLNVSLTDDEDKVIPDGKVKTISMQYDYFGKENMEIVAGYSMVLAPKGLVQHRADLFLTYFTEKVGIELYDAFLLRTLQGETAGNRLGLKFTWFANETVSPYVRFNWFKNYGYSQTDGGFAWEDCQICGPGADKSLFALNAGIGFVLTENISGTLGFDLKINMASDTARPNSWAIPLGLTASF